MKEKETEVSIENLKPPKKPIDWKGGWDTTKKVLMQSKVTGVSILNGSVGDHLERFDLGIAQDFAFYRSGVPISLTKPDLQSIYTTSKICILVHGLVSDETKWKFKDESVDYGTLLEKDFGYTPFYVRYNSGRHISDNGKEFDSLIESLIKNLPKPIKEILFVSHSMGALVTRSACYYAEERKSKWVSLTKKVIFIGAPHHGASLEKFSNVVTTILDKIPNIFVKLTKMAINLRSAGIKDLRYGLLVEEDWKGKDPDSFLNSEKTHVPLLGHADYYVISGTVTKDPNHILSEIFGDVMVRKWSATGKSGNTKYDLSFPEKHTKEINGISHLMLMHDQRVYDQLKLWLS